MSEAVFTPPTVTFDPVGSALSAYGQTQSLMQRAQQAREAQDEYTRQRDLQQQIMPSQIAKAQADLATANATVQNYKQLQTLRQQFALQAPQAQSEYEDAMQLASYDEQARALGNLQQKYSWMQLLPEGAPFAHGVATSRLEAHQSAMLDNKMSTELDLANNRSNYLMQQIQARGDQTRQTNDARGAGLTPVQKWVAARDQATADGHPELAATYDTLIKKAQAPTGTVTHQAQVDAFLNGIKEATAEGDTARVSALQAGLSKYNAATHSSNADFLKAILGQNPDGTPAGGTVAAAIPAAAPAVAQPIIPQVTAGAPVQVFPAAAPIIAPAPTTKQAIDSIQY